MARYTVENCGPEGRESFLELMHQVFGASKSEMRMQTWDWILMSNPANKVRQSEVWLLKQDDQAIGGVILSTSLLKTKDGTVPVWWIGSIMTLPKHRGHGLRIVKAISEDPVPISMGFPREALLQMYQRYGGKIVAGTRQLFHLIDAGRWVASKKPALSILAPVIGAVWSLVMASVIAFPSLSGKRRLVVKKIPEFGGEFDDFWEEVSPGYGNICVRNKDFLNWRFVDCPHHSYTLYGIYEDERLAGYAVTRLADGPDFPTGFLVDFLVRPGDRKALSLLLESAVRDLRKAGAVVIKFFQMDDPTWFDAVFFRWGFFFRKPYHNMLGHTHNQALMKHTLTAKGWFMTFADSDIDY